MERRYEVLRSGSYVPPEPQPGGLLLAIRSLAFRAERQAGQGLSCALALEGQELGPSPGRVTPSVHELLCIPPKSQVTSHRPTQKPKVARRGRHDPAATCPRHAFPFPFPCQPRQDPPTTLRHNLCPQSGAHQRCTPALPPEEPPAITWLFPLPLPPPLLPRHVAAPASLQRGVVFLGRSLPAVFPGPSALRCPPGLCRRSSGAGQET